MNIVKQVGIENIKIEVLDEERPALVIYLGQHHEKQAQLEVIRNFARRVPEHLLKLCLLEEQLVPKQNLFHIVGAPTYILVHKRQVVDKILGKTTEEDLLVFIRKLIPELN